MGVFYFLFVVLFLSAILLNRSRGWGILLVFLMGFICAFRGINVGTDTINYYMNNFRRIKIVNHGIKRMSVCSFYDYRIDSRNFIL